MFFCEITEILKTTYICKQLPNFFLNFNMNYEQKGKSYYANIRYDLITLLPQKEGLKVLEIGAAYGETLFYLKENKLVSEAVGVDLFEDVAHKENYKPVDDFIFGNIEDINLDKYNNHFDVILLPDVLEHIENPVPVLKKIEEYLNENGQILVSMPNIRHFSAFVKIYLKGDFGYEEDGIFDYTHARFYCKKNIAQLIKKGGYKVVKSQAAFKTHKGFSFSKLLNLLTLGIFEEFLSRQYLFVAKK